MKPMMVSRVIRTVVLRIICNRGIEHMLTLLISFLIIAVVVAGMAIGVVMGRQPIKGSCGGMNNVDGGSTCELCGGNPVKCEQTSTS
ncbi:MAG: (Na+)-NQR maturation NqrM [Pseudomonadales bacterium]|nr:(Na+)-NQR maturation NqrM [Pseudomonadales bacterium]